MFKLLEGENQGQEVFKSFIFELSGEFENSLTLINLFVNLIRVCLKANNLLKLYAN